MIRTYISSFLFALSLLAPIAAIRAQTPGSLDPAYPNPATDQPVQVVIAQTVGGETKAIIGGSFSSLLDNASTPVPAFARFNADGSLDTAFLAKVGATTLGDVTALALDPDGKILVAGHDTSVTTGSNAVLLRFGADGTPDPTLHVTLDDDVESIAFQPGGNILVSGLFTVVNGAGNQRRFARLSSAGVLDTTFQAYTNNALTITEVKRIAVLASGGILAVTHVSEGNVDYLIQLSGTDGSVPEAPLFYNLANDGRILDLNVDSSGRVIVVGNFDGVDGHPRASHIARFGADGQLDPNFVGNPLLPPVLLQSVVVDASGQPLVGGVAFSGSVLFRLTADTAAIDSTFSFPLGGEGNYIQSLALLPATDGALLAAGQFSIGQRAANLLRVITGTTATPTPTPTPTPPPPTNPAFSVTTLKINGSSAVTDFPAGTGVSFIAEQNYSPSADVTVRIQTAPAATGPWTDVPGAVLAFVGSGTFVGSNANYPTNVPNLYFRAVATASGATGESASAPFGPFFPSSTPTPTPTPRRSRLQPLRQSRPTLRCSPSTRTISRTA